jgi:hypothetical protein
MVVGERHRILRRAGPLCRARYANEERESLNLFAARFASGETLPPAWAGEVWTSCPTPRWIQPGVSLSPEDFRERKRSKAQEARFPSPPCPNANPGPLDHNSNLRLYRFPYNGRILSFQFRRNVCIRSRPPFLCPYIVDSRQSFCLRIPRRSSWLSPL